jgi:photosystem II stability/assembly factor-like uncharacterized protein
MLSTPAPAWWRSVIAGILYSDDQGKTWTQAKVPTRQLLTAVFFVDDKHGWAVGHDAQILASADGGATWSKQFEDLKREARCSTSGSRTSTRLCRRRLRRVAGNHRRRQHWEDVSDRLDNEDQFHLNAIAAVKDAGLFIVGEQGSMFRSRTGARPGKNSRALRGSLFGVIGTAQAQTLLAYGLRGNLIAPAISAAPGSRSNSSRAWRAGVRPVRRHAAR